MTRVVRHSAGGKKQRMYCTNLRHLMPVDILRGSEGVNEAPGAPPDPTDFISQNAFIN